MDNKLPTFSKLWLAEKCQASNFLPEVNEDGPKSLSGVDLHAAIQAYQESGETEALFVCDMRDATGELTKAFKTIPKDLLDYAEYEKHCEVRVAVNAYSWRGRLCGGAHKSANKEKEFSGIVDMIAVSGDTARIIDWKTGENKQDPPKRNLQVGVVAIAVKTIYPNVKKIHADLVYTTLGETDSEDITEDDIESFKYRLSKIRRFIEDGKTKPIGELSATVGPHCRWCPSYRHCPYQTSLLRAFLDRGGSSGIPNEDIGLCAERILAAETAVSRAKDELDRYVEANGAVTLPGSGGDFVYGPSSFSRDELNVSLIADRLGNDFSIDRATVLSYCKSPKITKVALRQILVSLSPLKNANERESYIRNLRGEGISKRTYFGYGVVPANSTAKNRPQPKGSGQHSEDVVRADSQRSKDEEQQQEPQVSGGVLGKGSD